MTLLEVWFNITITIRSRLCFPSELVTAVDDYMPMYRATTRGQEDIALLTLSSGDTDGFEGEKHHLQSEHACCQTDEPTH